MKLRTGKLAVTPDNLYPSYRKTLTCDEIIENDSSTTHLPFTFCDTRWSAGEQMHTIPKVDTALFQENGYVLLKRVFSPAQMQEMRAALVKAKQRIVSAGQFRVEPATPNARFLFGDALSMSELREYDYVLLDRRVVEGVKQLLGERLVYFGDSSVQTGEGRRGFHKDNVDRSDPTAPDWQSDYTLIRFGVYFQDHSRHSGGLKVRQKSHNYATHLKGKMVDVNTEAGDVLIWSLRTTHSGNNVRIRGLQRICLHPRIEEKVPRFLRVPEQHERIAMFGTFGAPSSHLERYIARMIERGDYDDYWRHAGYDSSLLALAQSRGVELRRPVKFYASAYSSTDERQLISEPPYGAAVETLTTHASQG